MHTGANERGPEIPVLLCILSDLDTSTGRFGGRATDGYMLATNFSVIIYWTEKLL